jgi:cytochrome P450
VALGIASDQRFGSLKKSVAVDIFMGIFRLESRWGEDAHQFRPSRWLDGTVSKGEAIGPYANLYAVLSIPLRDC